MKTYLALVCDNSEFGKDGSIRVLLMQEAEKQGLRYLNEPLYKNFKNKIKVLEPSKFKKDSLKSEDLLKQCLVIGGVVGNGYNSGAVAIPQVGSFGFVGEISSKGNEWGNVKYAWFGGVYGNKKYGLKVTLPNDDTNYDFGAVDKSLITENEESEDARDTITNSDYIKKGMYVVKTKTCSINNYNDVISSDLDYKKIPVENTLCLKKDGALLKHNSYVSKEVEKKDSEGNTEKEKEYIQTSIGRLKILDDSILLERRYKSSGFDSSNKKNESKIDQQILLNGDGITIENIKNDKEANETNKTFIKFGSDGNLEAYGSKNINVQATKNINIDAKDQLNIQAANGININSINNTVSISANNVNIIEMLKNIIEFLMHFTTIGNQATQNSSPKNLQEANQILTEMLSGFDAVNKNKVISDDLIKV